MNLQKQAGKYEIEGLKNEYVALMKMRKINGLFTRAEGKRLDEIETYLLDIGIDLAAVVEARK